MASKHKTSSREPSITMAGAIIWLAVIIAGYLAIFLALSASHLQGHGLKPGLIAPYDLVAPQKTLVIDEAKSKAFREEVKQRTLPVFRHTAIQDEEVIADLESRISSVEAQYIQLRSQRQPKEPPAAIQPQRRGTPSRDDRAPADSDKVTAAEPFAQSLAQLIPEGEYAAWAGATRSAVQRLLRSAMIYPETDRQRQRLSVEEYLPETWAPALRASTARLIVTTLRPNVVIDQEATQRRVEREITERGPITKEIDGGTLIVERGETITSEHLELLQATGINRLQDWQTVIGIAAAVLAAFVLFGAYLYTFEPKWFFYTQAIALIATVAAVTAGIASFAGEQFPQFVPLPAAALVLSVIFGRRLSLVLTPILVTLIAFSDLVSAPHVVALAFAAAAAVAARVNRRRDLMIAGFLIGLAQALGYFLAVILGQLPDSPVNFGRELALQVLGGLSSAIVAMGSLPFLESIFGIATPFRVAELVEPDQPLLRQLEENAPGTYQHSLAVANLAEAGTRAINGNVTLARAGAMYHDIGKMVTPRFFIENQLGDRNPHDFIQPEESRARVLAHVTNGLELARKYGLPKAVQDFIPEHQGTTIMAYFYHKACLRDGKENVEEADYRYPGPKPQSRESAIVMLADVSEAVTHSLKEPSQEEVEEAITAVFRARWEDGQLTESGLTEEELEKVRSAFVRVWRTLHHERLKYPSTTTGRMPVPPLAMAEEGGKRDGSSDIPANPPAEPSATSPNKTASDRPASDSNGAAGSDQPQHSRSPDPAVGPPDCCQ